jgi:hypothetical protein
LLGKDTDILGKNALTWHYWARLAVLGFVILKLSESFTGETPSQVCAGVLSTTAIGLKGVTLWLWQSLWWQV